MRDIPWGLRIILICFTIWVLLSLVGLVLSTMHATGMLP